MTTKNIQKNNPSDVWEWVKYRLALKGYTFGDLARIHGVKKPNFTRVKRWPLPKYEQLIAKYVGVNAWDLWPDRYDPSHKPNRKRGRPPKFNYCLEHTEKEINGKDRRRNCHETQT